MDHRAGAPLEASCPFRLSILGGFDLHRDSTHVVLSEGSQRLLVFLALQTSAVRRLFVAGRLWPNTTQRRADASLRAALVRLSPLGREAIQTDASELRLADCVVVDLHESRALAHRLVDPRGSLSASDLSTTAAAALSTELLPDWDDDWVALEAEVWRQERLHALEALTNRLISEGRFAGAVTAALAAVRADPLRESSHAVLIRSHLAERNQSEAVRAFDRYRELLKAELGLQPTSHLAELLRPANSAVTSV